MKFSMSTYLFHIYVSLIQMYLDRVLTTIDVYKELVNIS